MKLTYRLLLMSALLFSFAAKAQYSNYQYMEQPEEKVILPFMGIKTNLLYDATATFNLGLEFRTGRHTSFDLPFNFNPWTFSNDRKWKHILVQPEFRWWLRETFDGHFFGLHGHYAYYNISNLPKPPFSEYMNTHRFEGWLAGLGVSYGYRWNFNHRWALEATVGLGYAYLEYDKFDCGRCGELIDTEVKHYIGPTKVGLNLIYGIGGKPKSATVIYVAPPPPPPPPVVVPTTPYVPRFSAIFITPDVEATKMRQEYGSAYLEFLVGRYEILPGFSNNLSELQRIQNDLQQVFDDADATITGITITGHASPEGTYASNLTLSQNRAFALKEYVRQRYNLDDRLFRVAGAGEDWTTLAKLVEEAYMLPEKQRVLDIINSGADFDVRESRLKALAGGVPYNQIKNEIYPKLRRSDYVLNYTVVPFTLEKGKEVLRSRPSNLSLNEMFLIANTYSAGSDSFNEVFEIAARIFPDSDIANINAAASALERGSANIAAEYLSRVKDRDAAYWNNLGYMQWLQGNKDQAAESFERAGVRGAANAAELSRHLQSIR